jgi:hypothetical protein
LDEDEQSLNDQSDLPGASHSVAEAYPAPENDEAEQPEDEQPAIAHDVPEDLPADVPAIAFVPQDNKKNNKTPQIQHDEEDEEDDEEVAPPRARKSGSQGATYFPVTFGSTNGGAIAIANSYSTGKGKLS